MFEEGFRWSYKKKTGKPLTEKQFVKAVSKIQREMQSATKPFADDSEEAKRKRRERAKEDFFSFCFTYLPHYFFKPSGEIHRDLNDCIEMRGKSLHARAEPREHGKSVIASFAKPLQWALCDISPYTILLSDTNDLGCEFIQWIKIECEENPRRFNPSFNGTTT